MQTENQNQINFGTTQGDFQNSIPMTTTGVTQITNNPSGGLLMGVGGGVGDKAQDVTFSTRNLDGTAFGTTKTTTTTTTTHYNLGQTEGQGLTTTYQFGQGQNGLVMGVGGGVEDNAVDVTYSTKTGNELGAAAALGKTTTTTTTTTTQYGLGQTQGQIVQGDGNGLVMGVGGGIEDNAVDVTYSTKTGNELGAAAALGKTTTTTTTTTTQ